MECRLLCGSIYCPTKKFAHPMKYQVDRHFRFRWQYVFKALFGAPELQIPFWTSKIDKKLHEVLLHTMWILDFGAPNRAPNYNFWKLHNLIFHWNKKSHSYLTWLGFKLVSSFHVWKYAIFDDFERSRGLEIPCALAFFKFFC